MITLYGIITCGSVKKATTLLDKHSIPFSFIDLKVQVPSAPLIRGWIEQRGIGKVLNTKGTTYKNLKKEGLIKEGLITDSKALIEEQIALLTQYPLLLKRPVITYDKTLIIGYEEEAIIGLIHTYQNKKL